MGFEFYKESYAGAIKEISIGEGSKAVTVGGETCYPFYQFEGDMPHKPKIAMEVWDIKPSDWPEAAIAPFKDVIDDPSAWAKKCIDDYGAEIIVLQLKSTDPNGLNASPENAVATVKKVLESIDVPLIVWGIANAEKDEAVFKEIAENCQNSHLTFGPVDDKNYKSVGAAAMGYGHLLISSSPIDVNLAKQVNILLENLGMPMDRVLIDPTTGGLGYGLEYSYSVMERLRAAAMTQGDDKLQMFIVNNLGNEIWKSKETKQTVEEAPLLGDPERRGILMEAVAAVSYLMAGSDILFMRHPESIRIVKSYIDLIMDGGSAMEISPIRKKMEEVLIDFASLSPNPDLTMELETNKSAPAKKTPVVRKATVAKKTLVVKEEISNSTIATVEVDQKPEILKDLDVVSKAKVEIDLEVEARKIREEAVLKVKVEAKAEEEARLKADIEFKAKADAQRAEEAKAAADREAAEEAIRVRRGTEGTKVLDQKSEICSGDLFKSTPASDQKKDFEKIIDNLKWVHKRIKLYKW